MLLVRMLALAAALAACGGAGAAHRRAGEAAAARGRTEEARIELGLAVSEDPADRDAWVALGRAQLAAHLPGAALRSFERAARQGREVAELAELRARRAEARARLAPAAPAEPDLATQALDGFAAWLRGEADEFPEPTLARALAAAPADELPAWLRPLRASLLGAPADLAAAHGAGPPLARLLVAFEKGDEIDVGADPLLEALARATLARDPATREAALAHARRLPGGELALVRRGDAEALAGGEATTEALRRFRDLDRAPLGSVPTRLLPPARPGCRRDERAFLALREAVGRDLGLATRLARDYVDAEVALGCRAADAARELARAEPRLGVPFADELAADDPDAPGPRLLLAELLVRAAKPDRARIEVETVEALSARRGPASARLSMILRRAGENVAAIGAARLAFALARGPDRGEAVERVVEACLAAGRDGDAERVFGVARAELPPPLVSASARRIAATLARPAPAWLPPPPPPPPGSVAAIAAGPPARAEKALLLIGLGHDGARGARALRALADLAEAGGNAALAGGARAEAALLAPAED